MALGLQESVIPILPTAGSPSSPTPPSATRGLSDPVPGVPRGSSLVYRPTVVDPPAARHAISKKPLHALRDFKRKVLHHQSRGALAKTSSSSSEVHYFNERGLAESKLSERCALASLQL